MAFLSKILFKPNKVLEILSFVCICYVFKCNVVQLRLVSDHSNASMQCFRSFHARAT